MPISVKKLNVSAGISEEIVCPTIPEDRLR